MSVGKNLLHGFGKLLGAREDEEPNQVKARPPSKKRATLQRSKSDPKSERRPARDQIRQRADSLATEPNILDRMADELEHAGLVEARRAAKLIYLVLTSRLLERPLCAVIKGPSSAGKNFITDQVISLFPDEAVYCLTGMSERALA